MRILVLKKYKKYKNNSGKKADYAQQSLRLDKFVLSKKCPWFSKFLMQSKNIEFVAVAILSSGFCVFLKGYCGYKLPADNCSTLTRTHKKSHTKNKTDGFM